MTLPVTNNVYGDLKCSHSLARVVKLIKYQLGLSDKEAWVHKSGFDGIEYLKIRSETMEFDTIHERNDRYLFNGAVGGPTEDVIAIVRKLHDILAQGGYESTFEIYDQDFVCILKVMT